MKIYGRAVWKIRVVCRVMVMDKQDIIVRFVLNDWGVTHNAIYYFTETNYMHFKFPFVAGNYAVIVGNLTTF